MQDDREAGQTLGAFFQHLEVQLGLLTGLELVRAVGRADGNRQRIAARAGHKLFDFFRMGVHFLTMLHLHVVFDAGERAEFRLDDHAVVMGILDDLAGQSDIVLKGLGGSVNHDGREAAVDAALAQLKAVAVVKVQRNRDIGVLDNRRFHQLHQIGVVGIRARALGHLQDDGSLQLTRRLGDALNDFHVVDVESADRIAAVIRLLEHFLRRNKRHWIFPPDAIM